MRVETRCLKHLYVAGNLVNRDRILGFPDVTGVWDPTLLFVLGCSEGTIRKHLEHLYKKLGVQTRDKVGITHRVICCNIFILLYADRRIGTKIYFKHY